MKKELEEKLYNDFPDLFRGHSSTDDNKTLMVFGFSCGNGWYRLIYDLCRQIQDILDKENIKSVRVYQVKEKFGGLRFYLGAVPKVVSDRIFKLVHEAEDKSYTICEVCGSTDASLHIKHGWYKTLCNACSTQKGYKKLETKLIR